MGKLSVIHFELGTLQGIARMICAHCNSENIKRFSVICEEGTSVETFSATSKPVWNTKPFSPLGKQKMQGTRTVTTELAKRCSPPSDPDSGGFSSILGAIAGGYSGIKSGVSLNSFLIGFIVFVSVFVIVILGSSYIWKRFLGGNKSMEKYKKDLRDWRNSWYCSKCGGITISK